MPTPEPHNLVHPRFFPELGRGRGGGCGGRGGTRTQEAKFAGSLERGASRSFVRGRFTGSGGNIPSPKATPLSHRYLLSLARPLHPSPGS